MKQIINSLLFFNFIFLLEGLSYSGGAESKENNLKHLYKGYKIDGLIQFGPLYGDKVLPRKDDSSSSSLSLPFGFPFFNKKIYNFHINTNGIISFNQNISTFDDINHSHQVSYISVFGSDIDTFYNGFIYHRKLVDQESLTYLSNFVRKSVSLVSNERDGFNARWAYLVTWYKVEPHRRYNELNNNTFQAAIFTDGVYSFCLLSYLNITWPNAVQQTSLKIGLNIDSVQNLLIENNQETGFSLVKNHDIITKLVMRSNMNFEKGKWLFRLDKRDLKLEEPFLRLSGKNSLQSNLKQYEIDDLNILSYLKIGQFHSDLKLRRNDDGFSEVKFKSIPFPIYSDKQNRLERLFIHTNGLISLDQELSYSGEITNYDNTEWQRRYIAPLWSDIDTRYKGDVFYREISDFNDLNALISIARLYIHFENDFKPTWGFMASWVNVEPYRNRNPLQKNSFQTIIFTDGVSSYIYFQYFKLTWPNNVLHKNIKIGFHMNSNHTYLQTNFDRENFSLSYSRMRSEQILNKMLYGSNMNKAGRWIFRLNDDDKSSINEFMKPTK